VSGSVHGAADQANPIECKDAAEWAASWKPAHALSPSLWYDALAPYKYCGAAGATADADRTPLFGNPSHNFL